MTEKLCRKAHALRNRMKTIYEYKAENIANQNELQEVFKCYDLKGHIAFVTINVRNYRIMDIKNIDMPFIEVRKLRENINEIIKGSRRK